MSAAEDLGAAAPAVAGDDATVLQDQQRELLRQRLADRQRELEAKRQKLLLLQQEQNAASGLAGDFMGSSEVGKNVASLMGEVMSSLQNLPKPAATAASATAVGGDKAGAPGTKTAAGGRAAALVAKKHRPAVGARGEREGTSVAFKVQRAQNVETTIKAKTVETFEKSVQAEIVIEDDKEQPTAEGKEVHEVAHDAGMQATKEPETAAAKEKEKKEEESPAVVAKTVSEEEKKRILQSPEFEKFFERTTKVVERLLGQEELSGDPFVDYSGVQRTSDASDEKIQRVAAYSVPNLTPERPVLDLRASPHFAEVFLASYGAPEFGGDDAGGCVLLWSLNMNQRPEYTFTCQSQACTAIFNRFQPSVILGGTYSGSIIVWDTRAQSKPVQRTPLSNQGHAHPVYSMELVGTQNAHNLISVDTDGRLCLWSLQMLGAPTETLDLKRGNKEVCIECLAFPDNEVNSLVLGSEDGCILQANIHGNKPGVSEAYESHAGAVTSLKFHPAAAEAGQRHYTDLLLSTSVDWTVKLWSSKQTFAKPLHTFDDYEVYVYDTAWHPTNPSVFSCVDGEGHLDLWNLANDWETPAYRVCKAESRPPVAKNKVVWSGDGRRMMTGDAKGNVEVWSVASEFLQPRGDELAQFDRRIEEAKPDNVPLNSEVANDIAMEFNE
ncbi:cytoplasmic dynein intermediate chain [Besnoitia besnoiti]|uniref:Cytoplasmic dynein intermediate chain n=1 Tax=Besnoitia besnoiti TaxID=94643 RepID=A0A2A9M6Y9_BESBE|nr:cytoplasmic dynein intermediate chain [Besnoitia besnoiti]PFH31403.1 cytoplasmic dynein intermediate chain [Besnoitia besnoiti]